VDPLGLAGLDLTAETAAMSGQSSTPAQSQPGGTPSSPYYSNPLYGFFTGGPGFYSNPVFNLPTGGPSNFDKALQMLQQQLQAQQQANALLQSIIDLQKNHSANFYSYSNNLFSNGVPGGGCSYQHSVGLAGGKTNTISIPFFSEGGVYLGTYTMPGGTSPCKIQGSNGTIIIKTSTSGLVGTFIQF
jgi:hypothetical protein